MGAGEGRGVACNDSSAVANEMATELALDSERTGRVGGGGNVEASVDTLSFDDEDWEGSGADIESGIDETKPGGRDGDVFLTALVLALATGGSGCPLACATLPSRSPALATASEVCGCGPVSS